MKKRNRKEFHAILKNEKERGGSEETKKRKKMKNKKEKKRTRGKEKLKEKGRQDNQKQLKLLLVGIKDKEV